MVCADPAGARRRWAVAAVYAAVIFIQSALPPVLRTPLLPGADKVVHLAVYAVLAVLICRALGRYPLAGCSRAQVAAAAVVIAALYGATDEIHQALVPARCADIFDWAADLAGSAAGAFLWAARRPRRS